MAAPTEWTWRFGTVDETTEDGIALRADVYQQQDGKWFGGSVVGQGEPARGVFDSEAEAVGAVDRSLGGTLRLLRPLPRGVGGG